MTKKEILGTIKDLLDGTERVFYTPSLCRLNKAALLKKLDVLQLLLIAQKKYSGLVNTMGLTIDDLVFIALNGPQDKTETEMVMWQSLVNEYAEQFSTAGQ